MNRSDPHKRLLDLVEHNAWLFIAIGIPALGGILGYFANWSPAELIGLIAVLVAAGIATTGLLFWRRVRLAQADAALKQGMLQRGLTPDEIERLIRVDTTNQTLPRADDAAIEELAECLGACEVPEAVIEQIMGAVRAAEPPMRQPVCSAVLGLVRGSGGDATEEKILAVVRGLTKRTVEVYVLHAKRDIPAGTVIADFRDWFKPGGAFAPGSEPPESLTFAGADEIPALIGQVVRRTVAKGEVVRRGDIGPASQGIQ